MQRSTGGIIVLMVFLHEDVSFAAEDSREEPPNIVFVFSDDHACSTISAYGGDAVHSTPHIDRIAQDGVLFLNSFCENSICCPSRAAVLTGKYSHTNGVTHNGAFWNGQQFLFPRLMRQHGYRTALFGKWHLCTDPGDEFNTWKILINNGGQGRYYNPEFRGSDGEEITRVGYSTDIITDDALSWVSANRDKPFVVMINFKGPHVHRTPALRFADLYDDVKIPEPVSFDDDFRTRPDANDTREQ